MLHDFDAVLFISEPPEFDYIGGLFHIRQKVGADCVIERVMRPHVYMQSVRRAVEAARKHRFGGAEIIDFPQGEEAESGHG